MADWTMEGSAAMQASAAAASGSPSTETQDRTSLIAARLKKIYSKVILPVEK